MSVIRPLADPFASFRSLCAIDLEPMTKSQKKFVTPTLFFG